MKHTILKTTIDTPLGPMVACATETGVCLLEFSDRKILDKQFNHLKKLLNANIVEGDNAHLSQLKNELAEYFAGKRRSFDMTLHISGTEFQKAAWQMIRTIPYGFTATYQEQAEKLNKPKAVRAVAAANGQNRIAIVIPCHRVIAKNGHLTGYGGGLKRKKWLLDHERI